MNHLFYIQLITSFFAGGLFIAFLSFLAEKVKPQTAGIIIAFPSTAMISFFFLGWSLSAQTVSEIVPVTFIPLGISVLFSAIYTFTAFFLAKYIAHKLLQIFFTFLLSSFLWILLNYLFIQLNWQNFWFGIAVYVCFVLFTHFIMHRKPHKQIIMLSYTFGQKIGRAVFAGLVIALVVFLGKTFSPFWGGIFSMFPSAMSFTLMILHWYYQPEQLFAAVQRFALGSFSILAYSLSAMFLFPILDFVLGTLAALCISLAISFLLSKVSLKQV
jgi:hypothetical protein